MSVGTCLQAQLAKFPVSGQQMLAKIVLDPSFRGVMTAQQVNGLASAIGESVGDLMLLLVAFAQCYASPPISDYPVGVVAQGQTGNVYFGANMEWRGTALTFTVHGEQSATTNAWLNGEQGLTSMAISAAPCGYCRQFLYEITTASTLQVLVGKPPPTLLVDLLPDAFGPKDIDPNAPLLMSPENHQVTLDPPPSDPVVIAALKAANASHAPYSGGPPGAAGPGCFSGIALQTASGAVYVGRYAENAAFNPSMSPLESALTMWSLGGDTDEEITRVVLVEVPSRATQVPVTNDLLAELPNSTAQLEVHWAKAPPPSP
jgi:cytidine deaminase